MATGRALVIGDVYTLSRHQEEFLESVGIELTHVPAEKTSAAVLVEIFDVAIAGVTASGPDLSAVVKQVFRQEPELPIILLADDVRMRDAYTLGQDLAYDVIPRIVDNGWLVHKVKLAIMQRQQLLEIRALSLSNSESTVNAPEIALPERSETPTFDSEPLGFDSEESGDLYQSTERKVILQALAKTRWNRRKAARMLGISYNTLRRRIERYQLNTSYPA